MGLPITSLANQHPPHEHAFQVSLATRLRDRCFHCNDGEDVVHRSRGQMSKPKYSGSQHSGYGLRAVTRGKLMLLGLLYRIPLAKHADVAERPLSISLSQQRNCTEQIDSQTVDTRELYSDGNGHVDMWPQRPVSSCALRLR